MTAAPRFCGPGLLLILLAALGCSALSPAPASEEPAHAFVVRQYLERGRAAWASGNEPNARFLIGKAVELDPANEDALALWLSHWPLDSLPPPALVARAAVADSSASAIAGRREPPDSVGGEAVAAAPGADGDIGVRRPPPEVAPSQGAAPSPPAAPEGPQPSAGAEALPPAPGPYASDAAPAREGSEATVLGVPGPPPPPPDPETLARAAALRASFESARSRGDRTALKETGDVLMQAQPGYLPDVYRVLSTWVATRLDPPAAEARVRDLLGSLEFGDPAFLVGKPPDLVATVYLRAYRGRFLDLLGWSAFLRGDMGQAEAALRSAETEINLRGRGDVSHLRHLAAFYERKGNLAEAESYAIAAAARDTSGSGEVQAAVARLWTQRHRGNRAGLDTRLAEEAARVRLEERGAAISGRLYAPLPVFKARRSDGTTLTERSVRGRVTVLVLWEPGCAECRRLLGDLAATPLAFAAPERGGKPRAAVEMVAVDLASPPAEAAGGASGSALPSGIVGATPENPAGLGRSLAAGELPLTLVVEPAGFIQYRHTGYPAELEARQRWLERLRWQVGSLVSLRAEAPAR